jgi:hypothetical protein
VALADAVDPSAGSVLQDAAHDSATPLTAGNAGSSSSSANMQQAANTATTAAHSIDELARAVDVWQGTVFGIVERVHHTLQLLGLGIAAQPSSSGCSSNSSKSSEIHGRVRWAYLLQLARFKKLATAFDEMASAASHFEEVSSTGIRTALTSVLAALASIGRTARGGSPGHTYPEAAAAAVPSRQQATAEVYSASLQFCRVLAGAAPLPHLCNNLGCSSLAAGGTEAAAAVKVCSGCGAWYCSAGCAAAHWRQHKKACRRMAALRLNVNA